MTIEYSYSGILKKHVVRTKGIALAGRGITKERDEATGWNVYKLTAAAFQRVAEQYPDMKAFW